MSDERVRKLAHILVDYSAHIEPGDRVLLEATTAAQPLVTALYELILERGAYPHPLLDLPDQAGLLLQHASEDQLRHTPVFRKLAYEQFESRIRIHSLTDLHALDAVDPSKQALRSATLAPILKTQMKRGAAGEFKWVTTLFPTQGYADEAGMSLPEFEDFVYNACHADAKTKDPVAFWEKVRKEQERLVERFDGGDKVSLRGPNVDLELSVKGRTFLNASGRNNMPDGEIFTGPVENSVNGWVRFTYPAIYEGRMVEGVELNFVDGQVLNAKAEKNQDYLVKMLDADSGARYLGEFAIGNNYEIDRFTGNILFDEKIGGSFHMALGAGYPETGSKNHSVIHWDMICDMRQDSEIRLDGETIYRDGKFVF